MVYLICFYLTFVIQFLLSKQLQCGQNNIEHCLECNQNFDICDKCEDKYFPLFGGGAYCIRCNDADYGTVGCEGNCDGSQYETTRHALCDKNGCAKGFYNVLGICYNCSLFSENCIECSYEQSSENSPEIFTCLKCVNNDYRVKADGKCHLCQVNNCLECKYQEGTNKDICLKCENGYYIDNGVCRQCHYNQNNIQGGYCQIYYCPDGRGIDYSSKNYCNCNSGYVSTGKNTCVSCPSNCYSCIYDKNTNSGICEICQSKYIKNANNECVSCGLGCQSCDFDSNGNIICLECERRYRKTENGGCKELIKPENCLYDKVERFKESDYTVCTKCNNYYLLNETTNICINCPSNCKGCYFDNSNQKLLCNDCDYDFVLNENKYCESCSNNEMIGGIGCIHCKYENNINKCTECRYNYTLIEDDAVCKLSSIINLNETCERAIRLENGDYSCTKCRKGNYTLMTRYNNTNDCYPGRKELINCDEGNEDIDGTSLCRNCKYHYPLIWNEKYNQYVCDNKCAPDYFFNYHYDEKWDFKGCFKCDDQNGGGQIGCNSTLGCHQNSADEHFYCQQCKDGYFKYNWQCLPCSSKDGNCTHCHYDTTENKFKCDKCKEKFYVNKETYLCDIITYDEYPEITPGCILPINNYTLYKENNTCFRCKDGFFKTKDESCIYCKARKNGGPKCKECQYILDAHGIETNKINCKICPEGNIFTPRGKCYNCFDEVGAGCKECTIENEEIFCNVCENDYEMNDEGFCTFKFDEQDNNCLIYNYSNNAITSKRRLIEKPRCLICHDGYYAVEGICESLSLKICSLKSIHEKSIYNECKKFCEMMYYSFVDYKENNEEIKNIIQNNISLVSLEEDIIDIIENGNLCINNIDENIELRKCIEIEYTSSKKYKCSKCINGYKLDSSNNQCVQIKEIEEKNTSKKECNNNTIEIEEDGFTFCEEPIGELEGCSNGTKADTQYLKTKYNCYNCSLNYMPFFSSFYNRTICLGAVAPPQENEKKLAEDAYKGIDKDTSIENGTCSIKNTFTPDGKNCYLCKNKDVGMPGCDGSCTYSLFRNNIIECDGNCSLGFVETSKGVCESCQDVNKGCSNCSIFENKIRNGKSGFQGKTGFKCLNVKIVMN